MKEVTRGMALGQEFLRVSTLSSCSDRPLADFLREVSAISSVHVFDLFILREIDVREIDLWLDGQHRPRLVPPMPPGTQDSARILAVEENLPSIYEWIVEQFCLAAGVKRSQECHLKIAALATFFKDVTSRLGEIGGRQDERITIPGTDIHDFTPRAVAMRALRNTVRLAIKLKETGLIAESCWDRKAAIVEMVCGTVLDRCSCEECRPKDPDHVIWAVEFDPNATLARLCEGLQYVVNAVRAGRDILDPKRPLKDCDFALAVEVEPGPTYLLNGAGRVAHFFSLLRDLDAEYERLGKPELKVTPHIGLNADIAHLRITNIPARNDNRAMGLEYFKDHVVHAHLCDHPSMHTRDQVVGAWEPATSANNGHRSYLKLLTEIARGPGPRKNGLPFSATVALELEGCNRIAWVHRSLLAMKHLVRLAARLP